MQFIKDFFKHDSVIGLCGLKRKTAYTHVTIPIRYKQATISNTQNNFFLN